MILNKVIVGQIKSSLRTCRQRLESDWRKFKRWWRKDPLTRSLATGAYGLGLFLLIVNFLVCGGILKVILTAGTEKETVEFVAYTISTIFTPIIVVVSLRLYWHRLKFQWREKFKSWWKENQLINSLIVTASLLGVFLLITMITCEGGIFASILGTSTSPETGVGTKQETIKFIALGIGGILAAIGAIALSRRASAQIENNKLIEKGHIDERFKSATENLGSQNTGTRIAAFYQFYYLAKDSKDDNLKENILNILCSHLRNITNANPNHKEENTDSLSEECNILLDILFKPSDKSVFGEFKARLWKVNLKGANLSGMNLTGVKISGSDFTGATFSDANLSGIEISDTNLTQTNFVDTKLEGAKFSNLDITDAVFALACLTKASFSSATVAGASFDRANMTGAKFSFSDFLRTNFMDTNLTNAEFVKGYFKETNFRDANLTNANFTSVSFESAIFIDANLENACFREAFMSDIEPHLCTYFNEVSNIEGADFRGADIDKNRLPIDKGRYIANWTSDKFWDDVEKNLKS